MPPISCFVIFGVLIVGVIIYNAIHRSKYNKLMSYFEQHYPQIYEQIRIKPVFGPFYARDAYKTSIDYAKKHEPLDDPIAEELLADYAQYSEKGILIMVAVVTIIGISFMGWMLWS